jgi:hypothetical protein
MSYFEDYIEDGLCCEGCGEFLGGDEPGFIRRCAACEQAQVRAAQPLVPQVARYPEAVKLAKPYSCQILGCGKRFATQTAKNSHRLMAHGLGK